MLAKEGKCGFREQAVGLGGRVERIGHISWALAQWPSMGNSQSSFMRRTRSAVVAVCVLVMGGLAAERYLAYLGRADERVHIQVPMAEKVTSHVPSSSLVLSLTGGDPTLLYLSNRKGWLIGPQDLDAKRLIALRDRGAVAIFGDYGALSDPAERNALMELKTEMDIVALHDDDRNFFYRFSDSVHSLSSP